MSGAVTGRAEIVNEHGLHLRAADRFVRLAKQFRADVRVRCDGRPPVDGKSILDLAILAAVCGTALELEAEGPDAEAAIAALAELVRSGFLELGG
jgi:phosphocarrier protein